MNSIVAIGGVRLSQVVEEYCALVPSTVWTLGIGSPRDPKDPRRRSLESLLSPFMDEYFADEAQREIGTVLGRLERAAADDGGGAPLLRAETVVQAAAHGLAAAMSLVEMLDRAHALEPVELVLGDESTPSGVAAAWASARGLPSITVPDQARLGRFALAEARATIIQGPWARRAARELRNIKPGDAVVIDPGAPDAMPTDADRAALRSNSKQAFARALGWELSDVVIVFEPVTDCGDSALDETDAVLTSLRAIFGAFVMARAEVPALRLAVIAEKSSAEIAAQVGRAAAEAGLNAKEFVFTISDHHLWIAGADIVVSSESARSAEAALAGVPTVNLWRPVNWYRGPAFGAEDGVVEVTAQMLGPTLAALAANAGLRTQIAAVAADQIGVDAPCGRRAAVAVARELQQRRRPAPPHNMKAKPDILVVGPDYRHDSAGVRALYRLCHFINMCGGNASIYPGKQMHPTWNTPRRDFEITDETIVIYPESTEKIFTRGRNVRWVLNVPGLLAGPKHYGPDEMVFYWRGYGPAAQAATAEKLDDERELTLFTIDPALYFNDRSRHRLYDCVYVGKGKDGFARSRPRELRDAFIIRTGESPWPASRAETAELLRGCRRLYTYDLHTAIVEEAVICGVEVFYVHPDGELERDCYDPTGYSARFFDSSPVERFLCQLEHRYPAAAHGAIR